MKDYLYNLFILTSIIAIVVLVVILCGSFIFWEPHYQWLVDFYDSLDGVQIRAMLFTYAMGVLLITAINGPSEDDDYYHFDPY
jgi:hypothetical protein